MFCFSFLLSSFLLPASCGHCRYHSRFYLCFSYLVSVLLSWLTSVYLTSWQAIMKRYVCLSACLSVCLSVYMYICRNAFDIELPMAATSYHMLNMLSIMSVCLSVHQSFFCQVINFHDFLCGQASGHGRNRILISLSIDPKTWNATFCNITQCMWIGSGLLLEPQLYAFVCALACKATLCTYWCWYGVCLLFCTQFLAGWRTHETHWEGRG